MKIAIDCTQVIYGTGSSVYTKNLVTNLLKIDAQDSYTLFGGSLRRQGDLKAFYSSLPSKVIKKIFPISPSIGDVMWNKLHILPIEGLLGKVDVFHSSDWTQPPSKAYKVTTVHDLSPLLMPKLTHPRIVAVHTRRLEWVKKDVDSIIAPSFATKEDLITLGFNEKKVKVVYEAPDEFFLNSVNSTVKKNRSAKENYFLAIGASERKNTIRLIDAFNKFNKEKEYKLFIVGNYQQKINNNSVIFTGHISNEKLRNLYLGASALLYPSLYEGFGLPILEAFACGCPVVTSNLSSMAEIASDAAILIDPYTVESITTGITSALKSSESLKKKGFERVKSFNWQKAAQETLEIYKLGQK